MHFDEIDDKEFELSNIAWTVNAAKHAYDAGSFEEAGELYTEAISAIDQVYGNDHPDLPACLWNLGNSLYSLHRFEQSVPILHRLIQVQEEKLGTNDTKVVATLFRLATVYEQVGEFNEAERTYNRAIASAQQTLPPDHPLLITLTNNYSGIAKRTQAHMAGVAPPIEAQPLDVDWDKYGAPSQISESEREQLARIATPKARKGFSKMADSQRQSGGLQRQSGGMQRQSGGMQRQSGSMQRQSGGMQRQSGRLPSPNEKMYLGRSEIAADQSLSSLPQNSVMSRVVRSTWLQLGTSITLLLVAVFWIKTLKPQENHAQSAILAGLAPQERECSAADRLKTISFGLKSDAVATSNGITMKGPFIILRGDISDFWQVAHGSLSCKEIWYQLVDDGLMDEQGTVLYAPEAPENAVIEQMQQFAEFAQNYYSLHNSYPMSAQDCQNYRGYSYINPFTHRGDAPHFSIVFCTAGSDVFEKLAQTSIQGDPWINDPPLHPGAINSCSLVEESAPTLNFSHGQNEQFTQPSFQTNQSSDSSVSSPNMQESATNFSNTHPDKGIAFIIRGCGRDNQYIPSSNPGMIFCLILHQGASKTLDALHNPPEGTSDYSACRIIVCKNMAEKSIITAICCAIPTVLFLLDLVFVTIWQLLSRKKEYQARKRAPLFKLFVVITSTFLGLWFLMCGI